MNNCGTPACAFGHYAARADLQDAFRLLNPKIFGHFPQDFQGVATADGTHIEYSELQVREHFDLNGDEVEEIFGGYGCAAARTAIQAADYLEAFVARKWPAPSSPDWKAMALQFTVGDEVRSQEVVS